MTIGFDSVAALAAGRVDAATAFWNAEGVTLRRLGLDTREFRVDDFGAPPYPELILTTTAETLAERPQLVERVVEATASGYDAVDGRPGGPTRRPARGGPELDPAEQRAQLEALTAADAIGPAIALDRAALERWAAWEAEVGLVAEPPEVERAFELRRALERAAGAELAPDRLRPAPHLDDLGAALVEVADDQLALDSLAGRAARACP